MIDSNDEILTPQEQLAQIEKDQLTRRQALSRIGFQAGAAAVAALTADELFRRVGIALQSQAHTSQVTQQVARELANAGAAFATETNPGFEDEENVRPPNSSCSCNPVGDGTSWWKCKPCANHDPAMGKWPSLNCGAEDPDCRGCCDTQFTACMAAYGDVAICTAKKNWCLDRTCV